MIIWTGWKIFCCCSEQDENILLLLWTGWKIFCCYSKQAEKFSAVRLNSMKKILLFNWIGRHVFYCLSSSRSVYMYSTVLHSDSRTANSNASFLCKARQFTHIFLLKRFEVFEWLCIYKWLIRKTKNWQKIIAVTKFVVCVNKASTINEEPLH